MIPIKRRKAGETTYSTLICLGEDVTKLEAENERLKNLLRYIKGHISTNGLAEENIEIYYKIEEILEEENEL